MNPCPSPERWHAHLEGDLAAHEQAALTEHLESCAACQKTLDTIAAGGDSLLEVAKQVGGQAYEASTEGSTPSKSNDDATQAEAAGAPDSLAFLAPPQRKGSLGRLDHYEVLEVLGKGGFGTVVKAFDEKLHRVVAVKILAPELAASGPAKKRFFREAKSAAAVKHDNVVGIYAVADESAFPYLVMEYIEGQTLQGKLDKTGPLEVKEILRIGYQIAVGLASAHKQGLIHRDIKPANILLENGVERVKITDFGLARAADDVNVTQSGVVAGTPMYMSPEQAEGLTLDQTSDLFSLGTVLYVMCTGRPPFRASGTMAVLKRVCEETPRPIREINPEIPQWLCDVIEKLHAKKPSDRYQSAKEVADVLAKFLSDIQLHGGVEAGARRGSPDPAAGLDRRSPESAEESGDLRSGVSAGSGDPRRAEPAPGVAATVAGVKEAVAGFAAGVIFFVLFFVLYWLLLPVSGASGWSILTQLLIGAGVFGGLSVALWALSAMAGRWNQARGARALATTASLAGILAIGLAIASIRNWVREPLAMLNVRWYEDKSGPPVEVLLEADDGRTNLMLIPADRTREAMSRIVRTREQGDPKVWAGYATVVPVPPGKNFVLRAMVDGKEFHRRAMSVERGKTEKIELPDPPRQEPGWVHLFNGEDLDGWKTHPGLGGQWDVTDGILIGSTRKSILFSERADYGNFHLRALAKINLGGDSGIYLRAPFALGSGIQPWMFGPAGGYEVELHRNESHPLRTGSVREVLFDAPPNHHLARVVDESLPRPEVWFVLEIIAEGNRFVTKVNGKETANCTDSLKKYSKGHVAFRVHGPKTVVQFKKIEIKELPAEEAPPLAVAPFDADKAKEHQDRFEGHGSLWIEEVELLHIPAAP